jgi:hypothetical protein
MRPIRKTLSHIISQFVWSDPGYQRSPALVERKAEPVSTTATNDSVIELLKGVPIPLTVRISSSRRILSSMTCFSQVW